MGVVFAKRPTYAESSTIDELSRFTKKFVVTPNGCWDWVAGKFDTGYGAYYSPRMKIEFNTSATTAHRFMYELIHGKLKSGLVVDHLCRNRSCVNPRHLQAITNGENVMRGKGLAPVNIKKTHCKNGHKFTEENTYNRQRPGKNPERDCKACRLIRVNNYKRRIKPSVN